MRRKANKPTHFLRYLFSSLVLIVILSFLYVVWQLWGSRSWDGQSRYTFVLYQSTKESDQSPIILFTIEPRRNQAVYTRIPFDAMLTVPYGYASYKASSVYRLGELDPARGGGRLLARSVQNSLKVLVDGYLVIKNSEPVLYPTDETQLREMKKNYFSLLALPRFLFSTRTGLDKNISDGDMYRLWNAIRNLRTDQISIKDLSMSDIVSDQKLADGSIVRSIDPELLDLFISTNFQDSRVRTSTATIEVVNATNYTGLAATVGSLLDHLGAHVVSKINAEIQQKEACVIHLTESSLADLPLVTRLLQTYGCRLEKQPLVQARADIQIVLGSDFLAL